MDRKKITWVTADYFADCDIDIIPRLCEEGWHIHWIVLFALSNRYKESDFTKLQDKHLNLTVEFFYLTHRLRYPQNVADYWKLANIVKNRKADVNYVNLVADNPWSLAFFMRLPKANTIITAHQGRVHEGMGHYKYYNFLRDRVYGRLKNVNMFSKSQAQLFKERYKDSIIYQFNLALKTFGEPTNSRPLDGDVRFLSFGSIIYTKSIETLIDAACVLYERGVRGYKVSINGKCKDWSWYQQRIKYPEIFELDVRLIDNNEIPNLFNGSHYLVQPYRVVSQSGPTKIAYYYNVPNITSNLPGFTDEMIEGVTGYSFETGNPESLADRMQYLIEHHREIYPNMLKGLHEYVSANYSPDVITQKYIDMFSSVISRR